LCQQSKEQWAALVLQKNIMTELIVYAVLILSHIWALPLAGKMYRAVHENQVLEYSGEK